MRRTTVRSAKAVRVASSSMTMTRCGAVRGGVVLALPVGGQGHGARVLRSTASSSRSHIASGTPPSNRANTPLPEAELHAALGVDCPHLHPAVVDGRREPAQQRPQHGALAGPGSAGDQGVGAFDAEPPRPVVVAAADGDAGQVHLADPHRRDDRCRGGRGGAARARPGPAGRGRPVPRRRGRPGRRPRSGRRPRPGSARPAGGAAAGRCRRRRTAPAGCGGSCGRGRGRRRCPVARPPGRTGMRRRTIGAGTTGRATSPTTAARPPAGTLPPP